MWGLNILDFGSGAGYLAIRIAQLGNQVLFAEPARELRNRAHALSFSKPERVVPSLDTRYVTTRSDLLRKAFDHYVAVSFLHSNHVELEQFKNRGDGLLAVFAAFTDVVAQQLQH